MVKVNIFATEKNRDKYEDRGTDDLTRVPAKGELIEVATSAEGVLVSVDHVVHTIERTNHDVEVYCRHVASGGYPGKGASKLVS